MLRWRLVPCARHGTQPSPETLSVLSDDRRTDAGVEVRDEPGGEEPVVAPDPEHDLLAMEPGIGEEGHEPSEVRRIRVRLRKHEAHHGIVEEGLAENVHDLWQVLTAELFDHSQSPASVVDATV
jgi:hypothetical protein